VLRDRPEDLQAHYNLMLCHRGLATSSPRAAKKSCICVQADEASQAHHRAVRQPQSRRQQRTAANPRAPMTDGSSTLFCLFASIAFIVIIIASLICALGRTACER